MCSIPPTRPWSPSARRATSRSSILRSPSAREALPKWAAVPDAERVAKLAAIGDLIEKHHQELSELVTREQGKTQSGPGANLEVGGAAAWTRVTSSL